MSSDNPRPNRKRGLSALMADIQENAQSVESDSGIEALRNRVDTLELLIEEFGQARELQNEIQEYIRDLKDEVSDIRNYRFWITVISTLMSVSLFAILLTCVISSPVWFANLKGALQVPLIVALGGGSVFLMSLNLRGVYRSRHERHQGEMLPEAVKVGLEAMRGS